MSPSDSSILECVFANAGVGLCLLDAEGRVVKANAEWLDAAVADGADVIGKDIWDLFPETPPELRRLHDEARKGKAVEVPPHAQRRDGREIWCEGRITPVPLEDGVGLLVTASNITERRRTEEELRTSEARFHKTLDGMLEGCQLITFDWRYLYVNDAVTKHGRQSAAELLGRTMMEVYPGIEETDLFRMLRGCMTERTPRRFENEFRYADGSSAWFDLSIQPQPEGLFILTIDITERRRADEALRRSEASLRDAQRMAALGSWEVSPASGTRFWSEEMFRIFGRDPDLGPASFDELERLCPSEAWPRVGAAAKELLERGGTYEVEGRIQRPDGAVRWIVTRGEAIEGAGGGIVGLHGTVQDVTDRRHADESFRAVSDELQAIVQASPVPIIALDLQGNIVLWSAAAERLFGWTSAELIGRVLPIVPEEKRQEYEDLRHGARAGEAVSTAVTVRVARDGRRIPVSVSTAALRGPDGEAMGNVGVLIDLTEQTALREALVESEQRFAAAFDASPMAKLLLRIADRRVVEVNRAFLQLYGLAREDVIDKDTLSLPLVSDPDDRARFWRLVAEKHRLTEVDFAFRDSGGRSGEAVASAERLPLGGEDYLLVVVQDVTARKRSERELQESDARFRQLADTIEEVFWLTDLTKGQIVYISPAYEQTWGRSCEALYANPRDWVDAIHPDDRDRVLHAALTKQAEGTYDEEYRIVRPDGAVRWIRDRGFPVRDASGRVFRIAGTAQDITNRRELEAQLHQTQKMESIGQLAGGIAHDFNNMLTVISGNCQALREVLPADPESAEILDEIHEAGKRAAALTRQLLAFSRQEVIEARVVDLAAIIIDTEKMLRRILGEDVLLTTSLGPEPSRVKVDPGSWVQILMNLAVNARDAMPRGGTLTIETRSVVLGDDFVRTHPHLTPGRYVTLSVSDSGTGISPEVQARMFEPFFTTKGLGRGTGLGLSVVHGIVAQSGGHIEVSSESGVGTTFRMYIPAVEATLSHAPIAARQMDVSGTETILVVEDDESIRRVALRSLQNLGYSLLQAGDGVEALALVRDHGGAIDLLVTDVVMPRMGGRELAEALRARYPSMRVLYTSGYTDDAVVRHGIQHAEVAFLPKPYDVTALRQKVREVLDQD